MLHFNLKKTLACAGVSLALGSFIFATTIASAPLAMAEDAGQNQTMTNKQANTAKNQSNRTARDQQKTNNQEANKAKSTAKTTADGKKQQAKTTAAAARGKAETEANTARQNLTTDMETKRAEVSQTKNKDGREKTSAEIKAEQKKLDQEEKARKKAIDDKEKADKKAADKKEKADKKAADKEARIKKQAAEKERKAAEKQAENERKQANAVAKQQNKAEKANVDATKARGEAEKAKEDSARAEKALQDAKKSGDKKAIEKAQKEYDKARKAEDKAEGKARDAETKAKSENDALQTEKDKLEDVKNAPENERKAAEEAEKKKQRLEEEARVNAAIAEKEAEKEAKAREEAGCTPQDSEEVCNKKKDQYAKNKAAREAVAKAKEEREANDAAYLASHGGYNGEELITPEGAEDGSATAERWQTARDGYNSEFTTPFKSEKSYYNPSKGLAGGSIFTSIAHKMAEVASDLRHIAYILAGFGMIAFTWAAIFNKINWKHFSNIMMSLFILSMMTPLIEFIIFDKPDKKLQFGTSGEAYTGDGYGDYDANSTFTLGSVVTVSDDLPDVQTYHDFGHYSAFTEAVKNGRVDKGRFMKEGRAYMPYDEEDLREFEDHVFKDFPLEGGGLLGGKKKCKGLACIKEAADKVREKVEDAQKMVNNVTNIIDTGKKAVAAASVIAGNIKNSADAIKNGGSFSDVMTGLQNMSNGVSDMFNVATTSTANILGSAAAITDAGTDLFSSTEREHANKEARSKGQATTATSAFFNSAKSGVQYGAEAFNTTYNSTVRAGLSDTKNLGNSVSNMVSSGADVKNTGTRAQNLYNQTTGNNKQNAPANNPAPTTTSSGGGTGGGSVGGGNTLSATKTGGSLSLNNSVASSKATTPMAVPATTAGETRYQSPAIASESKTTSGTSGSSANGTFNKPYGGNTMTNNQASTTKDTSPSIVLTGSKTGATGSPAVLTTNALTTNSGSASGGSSVGNTASISTVSGSSTSHSGSSGATNSSTGGIQSSGQTNYVSALAGGSAGGTVAVPTAPTANTSSGGDGGSSFGTPSNRRLSAMSTGFTNNDGLIGTSAASTRGVSNTAGTSSVRRGSSSSGQDSGQNVQGVNTRSGKTYQTGVAEGQDASYEDNYADEVIGLNATAYNEDLDEISEDESLDGLEEDEGEEGAEEGAEEGKEEAETDEEKAEGEEGAEAKEEASDEAEKTEEK